jgi:hypothetical protein
MSFNRQVYDPCNSRHKFKESTASMRYQLSNTNTKDCYSNEPGFISHYVGGGVRGNHVDTESELKNIVRPLSECPSKKHQYQNTTKKNPREDCGIHLRTQYTREKRPCNVLSGVNINRFEPLCTNLQETDKIHSNCYIGVNSRLQTQDIAEKEQDYRGVAKRAVFVDPKEHCFVGTGSSLACKFTNDRNHRILPANSKIINNKTLIKNGKIQEKKCKLHLG